MTDLFSQNESEKSNYQYGRLADLLERKILVGDYLVGEKLPSIRRLQEQLGLSKSTIFHAFIELEKRGVIESRPKSGYYVTVTSRAILPTPRLKKHKVVPRKVSVNSLTGSIVDAISERNLLPLGGISIAPELLPLKSFSRILKSLSSKYIEEIVVYGKPEGTLELRRQIVKRMLGFVVPVKIEDIQITGGCIEAMNLCLRAVAKPGDTILVESPTFFGILQQIEDLGMFALEIPTDPKYGIHLEYLEKSLRKNSVQACLLVSNFQNPLGAVIPGESKKKLVEMLEKKQIPIIENDMYGDLHFGEIRPSSLKSFDRTGNVLYCSSFSKTLAPGLRVGWTLPGRFREKVQRLKLNSSLPTPNLNQLIISEFLGSGSYTRHLRKLRAALKNQVRNISLAIGRKFPPGTQITAPEGGFLLWVQLDSSLNSADIFLSALEKKIFVLPGTIFSTSDKYRNCLRISCGHPWDEKINQGIIDLGEIIQKAHI